MIIIISITLCLVVQVNFPLESACSQVFAPMCDSVCSSVQSLKGRFSVPQSQFFVRKCPENAYIAKKN